MGHKDVLGGLQHVLCKVEDRASCSAGIAVELQHLLWNIPCMSEFDSPPDAWRAAAAAAVEVGVAAMIVRCMSVCVTITWNPVSSVVMRPPTTM
jgi:hypothetical protein